MDTCPICGEREQWHYESGWNGYERIEPREGWCDFCGFWFQTDPNRYMDGYIWKLQDNIDCIEEDLQTLLEFKKKIPELKKRIDFDTLKKDLGWVKNEHGWSKQNE